MAHYRLEQASTGQSREFAGVQTFGNGNISGAGLNSVNYTSSSLSMPIYRTSNNVGVTVVMFHANDPGAQGAFDASEVLRKIKN